MTATPTHAAATHTRWVLVLAGIAAVVLGVAAGNPDRDLMIVAGALAFGLVAFAAIVRPAEALLVLAGSSVMQIAFSVPGMGSVTLFDVLIVPTAIGTWASLQRVRARESDSREVGAAPLALMRVTGRLTRAVQIYLVASVLSLGITIAMGSPAGAFKSGLKLLRVGEGLLLFPLGMVWMRSETTVRRVITAMVVATVVFAAVNGLALASAPTLRAGASWWINEPLWSLADPNEAGTAILMMGVLVLSRFLTRRGMLDVVLLAGLFALLVLTGSRSAFLALVILAALSLRQANWQLIVFALMLFGLAIPFIPEAWWRRMTRTLVLERGTFEAYSALVRIYGWQAAWHMFLDHPVIGVGYLGFQHFCHKYNGLGAQFETCDNMYLEVATGMGLVGVAILVYLVIQLFRIGRPVREYSRPGSLGWHLGRFQGAFICALLVAAITGDNWMGLIGAAQSAIWCAILIRSGWSSLPNANLK